LPAVENHLGKIIAPENYCSSAMKRKHYKRALAIVGAIINEWDPYSLLAQGAPEDEFEREIASVTGQMERVRSAQDAIHVVSRVFSSSFEPEFFSPETCAEVGNRIYHALLNAGILRME
jgi:hypothetical protein